MKKVIILLMLLMLFMPVASADIVNDLDIKSQRSITKTQSLCLLISRVCLGMK